MQKNYPILFNQNNYPQQLGSANVTIAQDGCYDCSFAMKANLYGHQVDPVQMNQLFKDNQIYVDGDLLPDSGLAKVFGDCVYKQTLDYEPIPTDLANIQNLLNDPATTVTLRINLGNGNYHFVEAVNCDGHTLQIANPEGGVIEDFSKNYGDPITAKLHAIVYTGPVVQAQAQPPTSVLATRFNQAITKSNNFDAVAAELGISPQDAVTTSAGQEAVQLIQDMQDKIKRLTQIISNPPSTVVPPVPPTPPQTTTTPPVANQNPVSGPQIGGGKSAVSGAATQPLPNATKQPVSTSKQSFLKTVWRLIVFWLW